MICSVGKKGVVVIYTCNQNDDTVAAAEICGSSN